MANGVAGKGKKDQYANVAFGSVTLSAANTLTFAQIQMAVGLFQGIAMLLHRILWMPYKAAVREIVAATDSLDVALTTSNRLSSIGDITDPAIIAAKQVVGIAANVERFELPLITSFSELPGGGKLLAANPIYLAATSLGFVAAATVRCQLDFTFIELSDRDYMEILQSQFPANVV